MAKLGKLFNKNFETKKVKIIHNTDCLEQGELDEIVDDIYNYFLEFRDALLNNQVDFNSLQEYDLAILRACRINLGLQLASGYTCSIEKLSSSLVCYRIDQIDLKNKKVSYSQGKLQYKDWKSFEHISVEAHDIDIEAAVYNMVMESRLSLVLSESKLLKEVKFLSKEIQSAVLTNKSISNISDEVVSNIDCTTSIEASLV